MSLIIRLNTFLLAFGAFVMIYGCGGSGGRAPSTIEVSASLSAAPVSITLGESTLLNWASTNADQCSSDQFQTNNETSGSVSLQPNLTTVYTITCVGSEQSKSASVTVTVTDRLSVSIIAEPPSILVGASSNLSWESNGADSCQSSEFETQGATSGSTPVSPTATQTYNISCIAGGASVADSVQVTVTETEKTFYVATTGDNNNSGQQNAPWKTIQFAVDQLSPGDTLIIMPGRFHERVLLEGGEDSGSNNAVITLLGETGAIIDGEGLSPSGRAGLITIRNASYVQVENLELSNFRTASGVEINDSPIGILVEGSSSNITLLNNHIHHIENLSSCNQGTGCGPGANGIAVYGSSVTPITQMVVQGNEVDHCILSSSEALTINGNVDGFKVLDNHVHDNNNIGIDVIGYEADVCQSCPEEQNRARNGLIKGNRAINNSTNLALGSFQNNPWYGADDGSAGGFYVDGGRNILFDGNYSSRNDLGFEFASEHAGKSSEEILMVNNLVSNNREVGLSLGGYAESDLSEGGGNAKTIYVYNNSFYKNKGWGTEVNFSYRVIDAVFANNIFFGELSINEIFEQQANGQYQNLNWLKNIWWAPDVSDVSAVQGEAIISDPLFSSPDADNLDLLINSPAIDVGQMQSNLVNWNATFWSELFGTSEIPVHGALDINGRNRTVNQIDLGASEFQ